MLASKIHRDLTEWFIKENPTSVTFKRSPRVPTGTGGWTNGTPVNIGPYTVRLVGINSGTQERTQADGSIVSLSEMLIADMSVSLVKGDQFTIDGIVKEILSVNRNPSWRVEAEVFSHV